MDVFGVTDAVHCWRKDRGGGGCSIALLALLPLIHNTILRGVNAIYNQAHFVKPGASDAVDFLFYNQCVYNFLHHHHMNGEETLFPLLAKVTGDPTFCDTETQ